MLSTRSISSLFHNLPITMALLVIPRPVVALTRLFGPLASSAGLSPRFLVCSKQVECPSQFFQQGPTIACHGLSSLGRLACYSAGPFLQGQVSVSC